MPAAGKCALWRHTHPDYIINYSWQFGRALKGKAIQTIAFFNICGSPRQVFFFLLFSFESLSVLFWTRRESKSKESIRRNFSSGSVSSIIANRPSFHDTSVDRAKVHRVYFRSSPWQHPEEKTIFYQYNYYSSYCQCASFSPFKNVNIRT